MEEVFPASVLMCQSFPPNDPLRKQNTHLVSSYPIPSVWSLSWASRVFRIWSYLLQLCLLHFHWGMMLQVYVTTVSSSKNRGFISQVCICVCVHACALAHVLSHSVVSDSFATLWTIACQAPLSIGLSRQQYWSGWPFQGLCSFCLAYLGKLILATQGPHLCPYFGNCFSSARTWLTYKCSQRPSLMTVTPLSLGWAERPSFVVRDSWPSFHPALNSTVLTVLMSALTDDGSCLTHHCMPGSQHSSSTVGCLLNWWVNKWMDGWIRMRKLKVKVAQSCLTLCDPWTTRSTEFWPGVGSLSLLQGIFPN